MAHLRCISDIKSPGFINILAIIEDLFSFVSTINSVRFINIVEPLQTNNTCIIRRPLKHPMTFSDKFLNLTSTMMYIYTNSALTLW